MSHGHPLSFPDFRHLWFANTASNFGSMVQVVGASWLMTATHAPPQLIAMVQTSTSLPIVLLALPAGALADSHDRRKILLVAQSFLLVVSVILALLAGTDHASHWILLAFTFLVGCGNALNGPAWQTAVTDVVPRDILPSAVAYNGMSMNAARSLGPAIGGAIVSVAGSATAFLVNAVSTVGMLVVLLRWHPRRVARTLPPERLGEAISAGLRYTAMSPHLRATLLRAVLVSVAMSPLPALLPLVARDQLHGGAITYGILLGSFGVGAVGGALFLQRLRQQLAAAQIFRLTALLAGSGALAAAFLGHIWSMAPLLAFAGSGWLITYATLNVSVQLSSPRWVMARALACYQVAVFAGIASGSWLAGVLADRWGTPAALSIAATFDLLFLLAGVFIPIATASRQNLDPSNSWRPPTTKVTVRDQSGPIAITIEHRIAEGDIADFLAIMQERRRLRMRDGAYNWTLLRDLEDPQLWEERFRVPTWLDYVRLQSRRTKADDAHFAALQELSTAPGTPVVRRMIERPLGSLPSSGDDEDASANTRFTDEC